MQLNIHPKIQLQGAEAYKAGKSLEDNPFRFFGGKGKLAKQAAWDTGWRDEAKRQKAET